MLAGFYDAPNSSPRLANMWVLDRLGVKKRERDGIFEASVLHRTERYSINAFDCKPFTAIDNQARCRKIRQTCVLETWSCSSDNGLVEYVVLTLLPPDDLP
jgi:hypothetical protein